MKIKSLLTQIIHKALFSLRGIGQRNGPLKRRISHIFCRILGGYS